MCCLYSRAKPARQQHPAQGFAPRPQKRAPARHSDGPCLPSRLLWAPAPCQPRPAGRKVPPRSGGNGERGNPARHRRQGPKFALQRMLGGGNRETPIPPTKSPDKAVHGPQQRGGNLYARVIGLAAWGRVRWRGFVTVTGGAEKGGGKARKGGRGGGAFLYLIL